MREPFLRTICELALGSSLLLTLMSCDMSVRTSESRGSQNNQAGLTRESEALFQAVKTDDLAAVKESLNRKADPNARDRYGFTPLMIASTRGSVEIVKALINVGADVNAANPETHATPLNMAILGRKPSVLVTLVASGANVNAPDAQGRTALHDVVEKGDMELLKALLAAPASDPNVKDKSGLTPLMFAYTLGDEGLLLLLNKGADVNLKSNTGRTALMEAAAAKAGSAVKILLERGADVNAKDNDDWTALQEAQLVGCADIISMLEKAGAKPN